MAYDTAISGHLAACREALLVYIPHSASDREVVQRWAQGLRPVHFSASVPETATRIRTNSTAGVALELGPGMRTPQIALVAGALAGRAVPLLLRLSIHDGLAIGDVLLHHHRVSVLRTSFRETDPLNTDVGALLSSTRTVRARLAILSRLANGRSGHALRIAAGAVALGERAVGVRALAVLCHMSTRTLEARCRDSHLPAPKSLLGWMLALHATWWITQWGLSQKEAATVAGLSSVDALSDRIQRTTGLRLARICRTLGFDELLQRFSDTVSVDPAN